MLLRFRSEYVANVGWRGLYRIFTVSKGCVAVTAPQAAIPPDMKALETLVRPSTVTSSQEPTLES
jgi:hypothetical protein